MDSQDQDEQNQYVAQLKEVFNSCDPSGSGNLDRSGITRLCQRLQLEDQATILINGLWKNNTRGTVNFDEFKDCFIALLTQSNYIDDAETVDFSLRMTSPEREVSPKYVWGNKKYGRRSRPESDDLEDAENDVVSDYSDFEVFSTSTDSIDQGSGDHSKLPVPVVKCDVEDVFPIQVSPSPTISNMQPCFKRRRRSSIDDKTMQDFSINDVEVEPKLNEVNFYLADCDDNESEYLQSIWKKLAVGKDGFLVLEELEKVCQHIGMENVSQEVVSQLFDKLDMDQDGKISFQEFRHLFENGESNASINPSRSSAVSDITQKSIPHGWKRNLKSEEECCEVGTETTESESTMFSSLDPDNTGCVTQEKLIELWESFGYQNGTQIMKDFGFHSSVMSSLDLWTSLEDCIVSSDDTFLRQLAMTTVQHELKHVKNVLDQLKEERNKLKTDISEANVRATILAQEVDDQNAKLEKSSQNKIILIEKKYKEQLQALQEELSLEREQVTFQIAKAQSHLNEEIMNLRKESSLVKDQVVTLQTENDRFENEIRDLTDKLNESQKVNQSQLKELEAVAALRLKLDELESGQFQEQQHEKLLIELRSLKLENQSLKDENDELALQIESLRQQIAARPAKAVSHRRSGSSLGEYVRNPAVKRRGYESSPSHDSVEDSLSPRLGKIHCRTQEPEFLGTDLDQNADDEESHDSIDSAWHKQCLNEELAPHNQTPVATMCEIKQVFVYLRNRIAEDLRNDEDYHYLNQETKHRLEDVEWERSNLERQLEEMENKHVEELECLQMRLEEMQRCVEVEQEVVTGRSTFINSSSQTDISIKSDRCQRLKTSLDVALNELEMSLVREAQGEELLTIFEQKYLALRNQLSDDLRSSFGINSGAGDSSPLNFSFDNANTKVHHISSNLLQLIVEKLIRPVQNVNLNGCLPKELVVILLEFMLHTKEFFGKIELLCGSGMVSCKGFSLLVESAGENLRSWLDITNGKVPFEVNNFEAQLEMFERKCAELDKIVDEKNEILRLAQDEGLKWKTMAETYSNDLKISEEKFASLAATTAITKRDVDSTNKEDGVLMQKSQETQTDDTDFENIEWLEKENLKLNCKVDELEISKSNLEKQLTLLDINLQATHPASLQTSSSDHSFTSVQTQWTDIDKTTSGNFSSEESALEHFVSEYRVNMPSNKDGNCLVGLDVMQNLNQRLMQLEKRCKFLEESARMQAVEALKLQKTNNQHHHKEVNQLKELLSNTHTMLKQQAVDYEKQLKTSDVVVQKLYVENAQIMKALQITEERQKQAEKLNVHLHDKCEALTQLVANIYKTATE